MARVSSRGSLCSSCFLSKEAQHIKKNYSGEGVKKKKKKEGGGEGREGEQKETSPFFFPPPPIPMLFLLLFNFMNFPCSQKDRTAMQAIPEDANKATFQVIEI